MIARRLAPLALAAVLASCKQSALPGPQFNGPAAVAVFWGITPKVPNVVHPYVAVASESGDELRIMDAIDSGMVLAPVPVQALSVPTDSRPALLTACSLADHDAAGQPLADLLAVASPGLVLRPDGRLASAIEIVQTWDPATVVVPSLDVDVGLLAAATPSLPASAQQAVIRSLIAVPIPQALVAGVWQPTPGAVRLLASLSGDLLLVADFARGSDGQSIVALGAPSIQPLTAAPAGGSPTPFQAVAFAASPDGRHVYAASPDPVAGVQGVAEIDLLGTPPALAVRGIDAGGPTTAVAAGVVGEFTGFAPLPAPPAVAPFPPAPDQFGTPALRVYASYDPSACGRDLPLACGVVVLDPVAGTRLPDPAPDGGASGPPRLPWMAPIPMDGQVQALLYVPPPTWGSYTAAGNLIYPGGPTLAAGTDLLQQIQPLTNFVLYTTGVVAAATSSGGIALVDAGHWAVANDQSALSDANLLTPNRTRLDTAYSAQPATKFVGVEPVAWSFTTPYLGLWYLGSNALAAIPVDVNDPVDASGGILPVDELAGVTPGFTPTDTFTLTWQGKLPSLDTRGGQLHAAAAGGFDWVAVQAPTGLTGAGDEPFADVARLYDPTLGVHVGDLVEVTPSPADVAAGRCPLGPFTLVITGFLYPDPVNYPGGAVSVQPAPTAQQPFNWSDLLGTTRIYADPHCLDAVAATSGSLLRAVSVRASGLVLVGLATGYAGRPTLAQASDPTQIASIPPFTFQYQAEAPLACPTAPPGGAWPPATPISDAQRLACEELVLARRARRSSYVIEQCPAADLTCQANWPYLTTAPIANGPVFSFRVALLEHPNLALPATQSLGTPERDTTLTLNFASGILPIERKPLASGTGFAAELPDGLSRYDRSSFTLNPGDGMQIFASYPGNLLLEFSPQAPSGAVGVFH